MATSAKAASKAKDTTRALRPSAAKDAIAMDIAGYGPVIQRPLSFFGKAEFLAMVAKAIDDAMARGLTIGGLLEDLDLSEENIASLREGSIDDFATVERLAGLVMKLFATAPELLKDAYLVWLAIPAEDRGRCRAAINEIDDATGFQILETFVAQNGDTLADFLRQWWAQIGAMMSSVSRTAS